MGAERQLDVATMTIGIIAIAIIAVVIGYDVIVLEPNRHEWRGPPEDKP